MPDYPILRFLNAMWWEFFQNIWAVVLFVAAVWLWARGSKGKALVCMLAGGVASALAIYLTERVKSGHEETIEILLTNIASMSVLQLLIAPYLGSEARWSNWKIDWVVGLLAGSGLSIAQALADPNGSPLIGVILHCISLGVAATVILISIRSLKGRPLPAALGGALLIVVVMTLIIGLVDYTYLFLPDWMVRQLVSPGTTP